MTDVVNATRVFLGDERRWSSVRVALDDVQALWGGVRVRASGDCVVNVVTVLGGGLEQRRSMRIDPIVWHDLMRLLIACDAAAIDPPDRSGLPDEVRLCLTLVDADGREVSVSKWAGVSDARFDRVQEAIGALAGSG